MARSQCATAARRRKTKSQEREVVLPSFGRIARSVPVRPGAADRLLQIHAEPFTGVTQGFLFRSFPTGVGKTRSGSSRVGHSVVRVSARIDGQQIVATFEVRKRRRMLGLLSFWLGKS